MEAIRTLQLGPNDFGYLLNKEYKVEWLYEPSFSNLPPRYFDVVILSRNINEFEFEYLDKYTKAFTLFVLDNVNMEEDEITKEFYCKKIGKIINADELTILLSDEIINYFHESFGEKLNPCFFAVSHNFTGTKKYQGYEYIELNGDYGDSLSQIGCWKNNLPIEEKQTLEFWLEYEKDDSVNISLEVLCNRSGSISTIQKIWNFSEDDLKKVVIIENHNNKGVLFFNIKAKGKGKLRIISLHSRFSRRGKGYFLPGGQRIVTSNREEIFYYFDIGNMKPPLNVYFSGYKTREGFEGYNIMRKFKHPFLLISESRLEGGGFYIGTEEYEKNIVDIIEKTMNKLGFDRSQVVMSGISMGTYGALYYGCKIKPNTIIVGKPLTNIGTLAENERIVRTSGFPTSLDVLHKECGSLDKEAIETMNNKFWNAFDEADWNQTRLAVTYMIEDDYDSKAYSDMLEHLNDAGAIIFGKGFHGRHNDDTKGIVNWFVTQYQEIIDEFDGVIR